MTLTSIFLAEFVCSPCFGNYNPQVPSFKWVRKVLNNARVIILGEVVTCMCIHIHVYMHMHKNAIQCLPLGMAACKE